MSRKLRVLAISGLLGLSGPALAQSPPRVELQQGVSLEVGELRRLSEKGVVQLTFTVVNASGSDISLKQLGLAWNHALKNLPLIDFVARRQYNIGQAASCLCSTFRDNDGGVIRAGQRRAFWAWYAAPPDGTARLALQLPDQPPLTDIPLL